MKKFRVSFLFSILVAVVIGGVLEQMHHSYSIQILKDELIEFKNKYQGEMELGRFRESIETTGKSFLLKRRVDVLAGDTTLSLGSYVGGRCVEDAFSASNGSISSLRFCGEVYSQTQLAGIFIFVLSFLAAISMGLQWFGKRYKLQAESLKREMKAFIHDLSSPMLGVFFAKDILKQRDESRSYQDVLEVLESSTRSIEKIQRTSLGTVPEERLRVSDVEKLVAERIAYYQKNFPLIGFEFSKNHEGLSYTAEGMDWIRVRPEMVQRMVDNLLKNACEELLLAEEDYSALIRVVRVFIDLEESSGVSIVVEDSGRGVSESQWNSILRDSVQSQKVGGYGVGLSSSASYLKSMGSSLNYQKSVLGGARFSIFLRYESVIVSGLRTFWGRGRDWVRQGLGN